MPKLYAVPGSSVHVEGHGLAHDQVWVEVPESKLAELLKNPSLTTDNPSAAHAATHHHKPEPFKVPGKPKE